MLARGRGDGGAPTTRGYLSERLPAMWRHIMADYSADVQAAA
jgi:hypothetical protein